jgi:sugar phosphate isomerase/epimerase
MVRKFSLAYLSYAPLPLADAIELAGECDFWAIGTRLMPAVPGGWFEPLIGNRAELVKTRSALRSAGVIVFDVELVRIGAQFSVEAVAPLLEAAAELGAAVVLALADDDDIARLTASFASLCTAASRVDLDVALEFLPWSPVADARAARRIVEAAGAENGRVLVDTLHVARSSTSLTDLASLPASMLSYFQLCDGPAYPPRSLEGLLHAARSERLLPGEGGIDLAGMIGSLPVGMPVSVEVPNVVRVSELGVREWVRRCRQTSGALVERVDAGSTT